MQKVNRLMLQKYYENYITRSIRNTLSTGYLVIHWKKKICKCSSIIVAYIPFSLII